MLFAVCGVLVRGVQVVLVVPTWVYESRHKQALTVVLRLAREAVTHRCCRGGDRGRHIGARCTGVLAKTSASRKRTALALYSRASVAVRTAAIVARHTLQSNYEHHRQGLETEKHAREREGERG